MGRGLTHLISIKGLNSLPRVVVGSCTQVFLCSKRYFWTGLPEGYLFSWQNKRRSRTRTLILDFPKRKMLKQAEWRTSILTILS